jgi:threonine synthase
MGIPIRRLICASNQNNILTEFFHTGTYNLKGHALVTTASPAIDILKSSNLERFLYHMTGRDTNRVRAWYNGLQETGSFYVGEEMMDAMGSLIVADWCPEDVCSDTIRRVYKDTGMF